MKAQALDTAHFQPHQVVVAVTVAAFASAGVEVAAVAKVDVAAIVGMTRPYRQIFLKRRRNPSAHRHFAAAVDAENYDSWDPLAHDRRCYSPEDGGPSSLRDQDLPTGTLRLPTSQSSRPQGCR